MIQLGAAFKHHQGGRNRCCCSRLQSHPLLSTSWRVSLLLLILPTSALLIGRVLGLHGPAAAARSTAESENGPQLKMTETLHHFRAHQVATGTATGKSVTKFVLQQSVGVLPTEEPGSDSSSSWRTLSFKEVAGLWRNNPTFSEMFAASIAASPWEALFWESAPVTRTTMDKPYEYVTVDSPHLASVTEDGRAFDGHVASKKGTTDVVTFRNIRKDARLVVPCQGSQPGVNYAHLLVFVRSAPREQVIKFFEAVGVGLEEEIASREDDSPVWLSTSGLGVYWLHARLDSVPKYYAYTPYKSV